MLLLPDILPRHQTIHVEQTRVFVENVRGHGISTGLSQCVGVVRLFSHFEPFSLAAGSIAGGEYAFPHVMVRLTVDRFPLIVQYGVCTEHDGDRGFFCSIWEKATLSRPCLFFGDHCGK